MLDQNYRSTQRILDAANAVIENNASHRPKHLWTDKGEGEPIVRYQGDDEHDEAAFVVREIHRLDRRRRSSLRRRRRLLPHERAEPRARGVARSFGCAVPRVRRREVLRPARDQGRARVPARAREPRRRSVVEADREHAAARCRRHVGREDRRVRERRGHPVPGRDRAGGGGRRDRQGARRAARSARADGRGAGGRDRRCRRRARSGADAAAAISPSSSRSGRSRRRVASRTCRSSSARRATSTSRSSAATSAGSSRSVASASARTPTRRRRIPKGWRACRRSSRRSRSSPISTRTIPSRARSR